MLTFDPKAIGTVSDKMAAAITGAGKRTVLSMALAAKDETLDKVRTSFTSPSAFMLNAKGYRAKPAKLDGNGQVSSEYVIAAGQSGRWRSSSSEASASPAPRARPRRRCGRRPRPQGPRPPTLA